MKLRAPFPWFGGKSRASSLVWERFGDVANYVEPFAGSLAVLLARPDEPRVETVNDKDAYLANFWRALQHDPEGVAYWADGPVNEADLHARHRWLVSRGRRLVARCLRDPHYFNVKVAGWWVWGQCLWIGSGWCAAPGWKSRVFDTEREAGKTRNGDTSRQARRPTLTNEHGHGVVAAANDTIRKRPAANGNGQAGGVHRHWKKRPAANRRGTSNGVHRESLRRWQGGGAGGGSGVHAPTLTLDQTKPDLSGSRGAVGRGIHSAVLARSEGLYAYLQDLGTRLRRVRVCCGDWTRVLTPSVTTYIGVTGVLLDPPYAQDLRSICYAEDHDISADDRAWALDHGNDPLFRIALCGYADEHGERMPESWACVPWKAHGGYSRSPRGKRNRDQERIWFSPHCLRPDRGQMALSEVAS